MVEVVEEREWLGDDKRDGGGEAEDKKLTATEYIFRNTEVPSWKEQLTVRSMVTSLVLSVVFNFIVCKLNLTTGVIPSLNVAAGLLAFSMIKFWTTALHRMGFIVQPFTRQENTVVQTCVVASSGIAFSSGTASYMLGMIPRVADQAAIGNTPNNVKELSIGWMMAFLFIVSFVGLFSIVLFRRMMVLKFKLTYPSGTATAYLINSFHTPKGARLAKKQVAVLFKTFSFSFLFAAFQWFFAGGDDCGFASFPTFGLQAYDQRFYFDFSSTYVGVGMLCPAMVNISLLFGAVISWGIMWPLIEAKKGIWYSADIPASSLHGIQGYRVFLAIAMILGDGLFHFMLMIIKTTMSFMKRSSSESRSGEGEDYDESIRTEYFEKDSIPKWVGVGGYAALAIVSIIVVPLIFHPLKWYHILVAYAIAPVLAFCNAYGCGLTDWSLASNYGKVAILVFSSWVGLNNGGVLAGLASCGVMMSIVSTASDLMQDFKTGYLTLASPRAMFFSQVIGTAMGCVMTPLVFWIFYKAYPLGDPNGSYPAPYALMYRGIALLGVEGFGSLPKHCLALAIGFFLAAMVIDVLIELLRKYETNYRIYRFIPNPMCMAIPFYLGGYFAIDMCVGSLILFLWRRANKQKAKDFAPAVASGLVCGESLWGIPAAILALAGAKAPLCMKFVKS
nr:probable metal-nicotianamine transporter YSL7 [Ipomoea batatas]